MCCAGAWWLVASSSLFAATLTFQEGVSGYAGTVDTFLRGADPTVAQGTSIVVEWDGDDLGGPNHALLRFDNIFGVGPGLIAPADVITSATATYNVTNAGFIATANEVLVDWDETTPYNGFGPAAGVQGTDYGTQVATPTGVIGDNSIDVTTSIAGWAVTPSANRGWIFRPTGGNDGVQFRSREDATATLRPKLTVVVNEGPPPGRVLTVKHQPYLQLGDAPLANTGPGIGDTDQIVIVWQTVETGSGDPADDFFDVEYRLAGGGAYTPAGPITTLDTTVGTRVNHSVLITGLPYNTDYDYRVIHRRNPGSPVIVDTYDGTFRTRKPIDDTSAFTFVAYGDSAKLNDPATMGRFEQLMSRTTILGAEFVTLLGDNVYDVGTHDELDARLDGGVAPNQSAYIRNHIEYFCNGNHDSGGGFLGIPSLQNYDCPVPILGTTSPVAGPVGETAEFNFSFDYGMVHFVVIDSTAWGGIYSGSGFISATRQANILTWLAADLDASSQSWKVVLTHHPPKSWMGHNDTGEGMAAELVPVLVDHNADLLLCGHSHNYQRSFPLTGYSAGDVTYIVDEGGTYDQGSQVIEVIAGTGGRSINGTAPTAATQWLARAFGSNNGGKVGPLVIDVSQAELHVQYVAADDGALLEDFRIVVPGPKIVLDVSSFDHDVDIGFNVPDDGFTVTNDGPDTLNYNVDVTHHVGSGWLSVDPISGVSTGEADPITVSYAVDGLALGTYTATISVSSPDAGNSPQAIEVTVNVVSVSPDFDQDLDVDMDDFGHLQRCFTAIGVPIASGCEAADLDGDGGVKQTDFAIFDGCLSGTNVPADPACDD